jgi:hypothetical protein
MAVPPLELDADRYYIEGARSYKVVTRFVDAHRRPPFKLR